MILYGYCLKPVQLFASRLARYQTFGSSNMMSSFMQYSKTGYMCLWETILIKEYVQRL